LVLPDPVMPLNMRALAVIGLITKGYAVVGGMQRE
jgi:hypothetical protein